MLLLGSRARTRTLEQRQVRATSSAAGRQSYSCTRLVRAVGFYGSDRPTVLETNRKPLIPFWFHEIGFVW